MSGWYTSAMNYDMMSPNPWNTMNLHMNQLWDHSSAWNNMFSVPQYSFDNFMPYGNMYGNSYLTNPMYTLGQMSWGTPMWNNMPWNNGGNMGNMWSNWGWNGNPFGSSNNNGGNSNIDSTANRKYNRLRNLITQLVKYEDGLRASDIDKLNDAMKNTKGTTEEKYERLLDAYNEIDKDTIKDFLENGAYKLGVSSTAKNEKDKDTFTNRLLQAGHDYEDTAVDDAIDTFYDEIKTLKGSDGKSEKAEGIINLINNGTYDILDFISSWNNTYKDDEGSSRVIDHIAKYYNEIDDEDQKKSAKTQILKPFVNELIDKANSVKKSLDKDSKEAIEDAISDVREALNNSDSTVDSNLSSAFDKLYLYTRQSARAEFANDAKAYYGEIDDEVFNDKLFRDDMIEDLEREGFTTSEIEDTDVAISEKKAKRASHSERVKDDNDDNDDDVKENPLKDIDKKSASEQVSILKAQKIIEELTVKKDGTTLYQEKTMTGDSDGDGKADYARLFYINAEGKLVEWENTKLNSAGTGTGPVKAGVAQSEGLVNPSEISKAKKETEKAQKEEEKKKQEAENLDAKDFGEQTATKLGNWTTSGDDDYIKGRINKLNKENILDFLNAYYEKAGYITGKHWGGEGIIEKLDDDTDNEKITKAMKVKFLETVLEKAKAQGLESNEHYTKLQRLLKEHKSYHNSDKNFNATYNDNGFWEEATNYNEAIDVALEALHKEMKAKAGV